MADDTQSLLIDELLNKLRALPVFGASVEEDFVQRVLDANDAELPETLIVVQSGDTEELERAGSGSVKERVTLNIALATRARNFAPVLRAGRLAIKTALPGTKAGLSAKGLVTGGFLADSLLPAGEGRRWSVRVMPLQLTYIQQLN